MGKPVRLGTRSRLLLPLGSRGLQLQSTKIHGKVQRVGNLRPDRAALSPSRDAFRPLRASKKTGMHHLIQRKDFGSVEEFSR